MNIQTPARPTLTLRNLSDAQLTGNSVTDAGLLTVTSPSKFIVVVPLDALAQHLAARAK